MAVSKRVLVTGASGYVGGRLVSELLAAGHTVRCLARSPGKLADMPWRSEVEVVKGDLADSASLQAAFVDIDVAYYLVHSMSDTASGEFSRRDRQIAENFCVAAGTARLQRIVYLGGLGDEDDEELSPHLRSRHEVGRVLASGNVPVTELRAAVIIGSGSASFEMLRHLVEMLPAMITPRWVGTRCQPIAIRDVLFYLVEVLAVTETEGRVLEIGGPEVVSYREMMATYAEVAKLKRRLIVQVPVLTPKLSSLWIGLVTPLPTSLAKPLVQGLSSEVIVQDHSIETLIPRERLPFRSALELAVQHMRDLDVVTSWAGADLGHRSSADPMSTDPEWSGGVVLDDTKTVVTSASLHNLFRSVSAVGGASGWLVANRLWWARGVIDKLLGGVGMRRGRRLPDVLRVGDALDFWRVEALVPDTLLRLRAEMKLPGTAWLEWTMSEGDDGQTTLVQRARYHPRGLAGRLYWYALLPFHGLIFGRLAVRLARRAEEMASSQVSES